MASLFPAGNIGKASSKHGAYYITMQNTERMVVANWSVMKEYQLISFFLTKRFFYYYNTQQIQKVPLANTEISSYGINYSCNLGLCQEKPLCK